MPLELKVSLKPDGKLFDLAKNAGEGFSKAIKEAAFVLQREIKTLIRRSPRGGMVYKRGRKTHTASAPGQPPATDTGTLMNSIRANLFGFGTAQSAEIGTHLGYGEYLEVGTSKMKARPFLDPAWENQKDAVGKLIEDSIDKAIK